jgi:hypothetical protein
MSRYASLRAATMPGWMSRSAANSKLNGTFIRWGQRERGRLPVRGCETEPDPFFTRCRHIRCPHRALQQNPPVVRIRLLWAQASEFCAGTGLAAGYIDNHGTWSSQSLVGADSNPANLTAVSCPATGRCIATGDWTAIPTLPAAAGRGAVLVQDNYTFTALSCASTT